MGWPSISSQSRIETTGYFFEVLLRTPYHEFVSENLGREPLWHMAPMKRLRTAKTLHASIFNHCRNMDAEYIFITSMHSVS